MLTIYVDGACARNGQEDAMASWGIWSVDGYDRGFVPMEWRQTSNTGELWAIMEAIRFAKLRPCEICSDSMYAINSITKWKLKNKPNIELIKEIKKEYELHRRHISFRWVKGHVGIYGNEYANVLAESMIRVLPQSQSQAFPFGSTSPQPNDLLGYRLR